MKKISRFNPALITKKFFNDKPPYLINKGQCFQWAYLAYRCFANTELWSYGSHAFIKYNGKFYDSERLNGELDWRRLPATYGGKGCGCTKCAQPAKRMFVPKFKYSWEGCRSIARVKWEDLDRQAMEFIHENAI